MMTKPDGPQHIDAIRKQPHCSNCGEENPAISDYDPGSAAGFTVCCHEEVCDGSGEYVFGNHEHHVAACCWAVAEKQFARQGVDLSRLEEIRRWKE